MSAFSRVSGVRYSSARMAATGSVIRMVLKVNCFPLPRANWQRSEMSQASSSMTFCGSVVEGAMLLPQMRVEPSVTTLSSAEKPLRTWYGSQPTRRQASSSSTRHQGMG